ncbi:MAG: homocysteine S-methyltransferase family protein [Pseudomonadota bacterium]|nr:homocysteine S-methyltransferase family protein [Pseudomonadota bacterium]
MSLEKRKRQITLDSAIKSRILVLDGAMGTMIQDQKLDEKGYRGEKFKDWSKPIKGNNDILSLTQPEIIYNIHKSFLEAGADITETNTFSSTSIAQLDYGMESYVYELNVESARIARKACEEFNHITPNKPRFVAGALGPTNRTASISPDVNDPGKRNISFDELKLSYKEAIKGLIDGDVDLLLIETIFDTLNAKAAILAVEETFDEIGIKLPIMISGTLTDLSGRTLSGQTLEAFWNSIRHSNAFSVGLNCALGADQLYPYVRELSKIADTNICVYPNAGLPNEFGEYDQTPKEMAELMGEWADEKLVNIMGGCCGTTPEHIRVISETIKNKKTRIIPTLSPQMKLSGLEPLKI